jgi:hypothetical protein
VRLIFSLVLFAVLSVSVQAVEVKGLYWENILVADRSKESFKKASQTALMKVVVRVTGQAGLIDGHQLQSLKSKAEKLVYEYQYHETQRTINISMGVDPETGDSIIQKLPAVILSLRFDQALLDKSLKEMKLPLWSSNRPNILLILVAEGVSVRRQVLRDVASSAQDALFNTAKARGVPITLLSKNQWKKGPLTSMTPWALPASELLRTAQIHGADAVLVGQLSDLSNGQWAAQWKLINGNKKTPFMSLAGTLKQVYVEGVEQMVDELALSYAIKRQQFVMPGKDRLMLAVSKVNNLDDYALVGTVLRKLSPVKVASLVSVSRDELLYSVVLSGTPDQFKQALKLSARLTELEPDINGVQRYTLNPK